MSLLRLDPRWRPAPGEKGASCQSASDTHGQDVELPDPGRGRRRVRAGRADDTRHGNDASSTPNPERRRRLSTPTVGLRPPGVGRR